MASASALWHRFQRWAGRLDAPVIAAEPLALPAELKLALNRHEDARSTWEGLEPDERGALAFFVASPRLRRGRARRAATVAQRCADGLDAVRDWMTMNRALLSGFTLGPPGWTG